LQFSFLAGGGCAKSQISKLALVEFIWTIGGVLLRFYRTESGVLE
jgi:hypothetical protein